MPWADWAVPWASAWIPAARPRASGADQCGDRCWWSSRSARSSAAHLPSADARLVVGPGGWLLGAIGRLPQPTVLYRQHGGNVLGAQGLGPAYWMRRLRHLLTDPAAGGHTRAALRQAACFEQRYGQALSPLPALMHLRRRSRCQALSHHLTHGSTLNKHGPFRTVALVVLLLLLPAASE